MVIGFAMFLASLYWLALLYTSSAGPVTVVEIFAASVVPLVAAMFLLVGSAVGVRHPTG
jgi:hypothetical protein